MRGGVFLKIGLAIITKYVNESISILSFLNNAQKFGRRIDQIIIVYSHGCDKEFVKKIRAYSNVKLVCINRAYELEESIRSLGIDEKKYRNIIYSKTLERHGLVEYGKYRNIALLQALFDGIDVLFFVDTDIYPKLLVDENRFEEVDFFGSHMEFIKKEDVCITTSDYSGYYIIPPMKFERMEEFFEGIQKKSATHFVSGCSEHKCLSFGKVGNPAVDDTDKLLGGNMAIKTSTLCKLPPFFSTTYMVDGELFLTRGEDTLMGICAREMGIRALDIDLLIFHDTYGDFPKIPDITRDKAVKDRFYYACMGWIGRNVFLNYINGCDYRGIYERQRELLSKSVCEISTYLQDDRFLMFPKAIDTAYGELDRVIYEYEYTLEGFNGIVKRIIGGEKFECSFGEPFSSGRVR